MLQAESTGVEPYSAWSPYGEAHVTCSFIQQMFIEQSLSTTHGGRCWDPEVDSVVGKIRATKMRTHCHAFMGKRHKYGPMSQRVRRAMGKINRKGRRVVEHWPEFYSSF